MPRRPAVALLALLIGLVAAAGCVRLGLWQLDRLEQRRALNAVALRGMGAAPVRLDALPDDTAGLRFRRVRVSGTFDFDREIALAGRTRQGSPGAHIITPLRLPDAPDGTPRAVLVNRGWVYSPDAASVQFERWREPAAFADSAYVDLFPGAPAGDTAHPRLARVPRTWRRLDLARLRAELPYSIAPYFIVALPVGPPSASAPVRLTVPALDEGPHKGYAIQWFSFAVIALAGGALLAWRELRG